MTYLALIVGVVLAWGGVPYPEEPGYGEDELYRTIKRAVRHHWLSIRNNEGEEIAWCEIRDTDDGQCLECRAIICPVGESICAVPVLAAVANVFARLSPSNDEEYEPCKP